MRSGPAGIDLRFKLYLFGWGRGEVGSGTRSMSRAAFLGGQCPSGLIRCLRENGHPAGGPTFNEEPRPSRRPWFVIVVLIFGLTAMLGLVHSTTESIALPYTLQARDILGTLIRPPC